MPKRKSEPPAPVKKVRVFNLERHRQDLILSNNRGLSLPPKRKGTDWPVINANLVSPSMEKLAAQGHIRIEEV